jgi:membrane protein implicated in regulation of membrane protease activity
MNETTVLLLILGIVALIFVAIIAIRLLSLALALTVAFAVFSLGLPTIIMLAMFVIFPPTLIVFLIGYATIFISEVTDTGTPNSKDNQSNTKTREERIKTDSKKKNQTHP